MLALASGYVLVCKAPCSWSKWRGRIIFDPTDPADLKAGEKERAGQYLEVFVVSER